MRKYFSIFGLILITQCFAINIPDQANSRVMDLAHLLTPTQQQLLNTKLRTIHDNEKGTEIQILTVSDLGGEPIEDVALDVGRRWKLGQKNINNGVLILIAAKDRQDRIEVGYGLEGVLPDGFVGNLRRDVLEPALKAGNYYQGLNTTIDKLNQQIKPENNGKLHNQNMAELSLLEALIGGGGFILICVLMVIYTSRRRSYYTPNSNSNSVATPGTSNNLAGIITTSAILGAMSNLGNNSDLGASGGSFDDQIGGGGDFGGGGSSGDY